MNRVTRVVLTVLVAAASAQQPRLQATGDDLAILAEQGSISMTDASGASLTIADLREGIAAAQGMSSMQSSLVNIQRELSLAKSSLAGALEVQSILVETQSALVATNANLTAELASAVRYTAQTADRSIANELSVAQAFQMVAQINASVANLTDDSGGSSGGSMARSCRDLWVAGSRVDGTYRIKPLNNSRSIYVYCDMSEQGWTLTGMVHGCTRIGTYAVEEPNNFFVTGFHGDAVQLSHNQQVNCASPMALGSGKFTEYISDRLATGDTPLIKVVLHAEENFDQTATYHKAIADIQTYLTLFDLDNSAHPSRVCRDEAMTDSCREGSYIGQGNTGYTRLEYMPIYLDDGTFINAYGGTGHTAMRMDRDASPSYNGMCSLSHGDSRWADTTNTHWGNAIRIWLK